MLLAHRMRDAAEAASGTKQGNSLTVVHHNYPCFNHALRPLSRDGRALSLAHCWSVGFERSNGVDVERLISAVHFVAAI